MFLLVHGMIACLQNTALTTQVDTQVVAMHLVGCAQNAPGLCPSSSWQLPGLQSPEQAALLLAAWHWHLCQPCGIATHCMHGGPLLDSTSVCGCIVMPQAPFSAQHKEAHHLQSHTCMTGPTHLGVDAIMMIKSTAELSQSAYTDD